MIATFTYLIVRGTRNRIVSQMRRMRSPRYAVALLLALGYVWLVLLRRRPTADAGAQMPGELVQLAGALVLLVATAWTWIVGADRAALAFTPAEVSLLFTAPVSRRDLIVYKLVRAQAPVLTTSVIWAIIFRHQNGVQSAERAIGFWVLLSTLSFHRLGVALLRASQMEHGVTGLRRSIAPTIAFGAAAAAVVVGLWQMPPFGELATAAHSPQELAHLVHSALGATPAGWVLYPFHLALAPIVATTSLAWVRAIGPALALLALHAWWVLRMDASFEEAAVEASAAHARRLETMRARRVGGGVASPASARRTLRLSPTGPRAIALVWKNLLWLIRTGQVRGLLAPPVIGLACALVLARRSEVAAVIVALVCTVVATMMVFFGPATVRNDLRNELLNLPLIRTLPLQGWQVVLAEVASSAPAVAVMQALLLVAAAMAIVRVPESPFRGAMLPGALAALPAFLLGLNMVNFAIHNGLALLFPAWVRLGGTSTGFEALGQTMLTTLATLVVLLLLLILPAIGAGIAVVVLRALPGMAIAVGGSLAGLLLLAESWVMIGLLGEAFDRVEPGHVG